MLKNQAILPQILDNSHDSKRTIYNVLSIFGGVLGLSLLAQLSITLPWTPVPITGQTFGVALMSLIWGSKRGVTVILCYVLLGYLGVPVFALGKSGLIWGPTIGYIIGMIIATYFMGVLSDRGWTQTFVKAYLATVLGSIIIFTCGVLVLSQFIPSHNLLMAGVYPFLFGDFVKSILASTIVIRLRKIFNTK